jgi:hypothetical protein
MACVTREPVYGTVLGPPAWDAGNQFEGTYAGDFYMVFHANQFINGAAIGANTQDDTEHFSDIDYGIMFFDGKVRAVEQGTHPALFEWRVYYTNEYFIVMRIGDAVHYLTVTQDNFGTDYFDDSLPGIPLPGTLLYTSDLPSYGAVFIDASIFGVGDVVCLIEAGGAWISPAAATSASAVLELPLTVKAAVGITATGGGNLTFSVTGSMSPNEGVARAEIPLSLHAGDIFRSEGRVRLPLTATGSMSIYEEVFATSAYMNGLMSFSLFASGEPYVPVGSALELPLAVVGAGHEASDPAIDTILDIVLPLNVIASGTAHPDNYFDILLPEFGASLAYTYVEITDGIKVTMESQAQLVMIINEFITAIGTVQRFSQLATTITEDVVATSTEHTSFALAIAEAFNITESLTLVQAAELASEVLAAGFVQTQYQAVVAVLSAVGCSDNEVYAGGFTGGGAVLEADGTVGTPAEFRLWGTFLAEAWIGMGFTTDTGGADQVLTQLGSDHTWTQAADVLAALLEAHPLVTATHTGDGYVEVEPAGGAATITL